MSTPLGQVPRQHGELPNLKKRQPLILGFVAVLFVLLGGRLWYLQVTRGEMYLQKSQDNFVKDTEIPALRGQIKDRKGRILAGNRPAYNLLVIPKFFSANAMQKLRELLGLTSEEVALMDQRIRAQRGLARFKEVLLREDIPRDTMAILETHRQELPGVVVAAVPHRHYPHGVVAAHALGFLNEISPSELAELGSEGYRAGQPIGRTGIERQWESTLRGKGGSMRVVVDARGQRKSDEEAQELLGDLMRKDPVPGSDVVLTLDLDLQEVLEHAMDRIQAGGAIALEAQTGRILALASRPAYDPNVLSGKLSNAEDRRMSSDPRRPRIDKVLRENYFPGSTFKIVPALAALEGRLVRPEEKVACGGGYRLGRRVFHCMEVHGLVDLTRALIESCNSYFYRLGEKVGLDRMAAMAHELGLGQVTGLGLNGEVPGFVPTTDSYKRTQEGFQVGSVLNTAIGQGSVKVTVLQLARMYGAVVNGGKLWVPQLIARIDSPSGQVVRVFEPRLDHQVTARPESLAFVAQALLGVVADPKGTAHAARIAGVEVGGKTGTAQVHQIKQRGKDHVTTEGEWDPDKDHAWFVGFAPAERPRIVVAALVEHGGLGARAAAPIVMEFMRAYFGKVEKSASASVASDLPQARR